MPPWCPHGDKCNVAPTVPPQFRATIAGVKQGPHTGESVRALQCPRGDLNPHARNRALAPQASASTIPPPGQWCESPCAGQR